MKGTEQELVVTEAEQSHSELPPEWRQSSQVGKAAALPKRDMMRPPPKSAVVRARWLAELAFALDEAHRLTLRLADDGFDTGEAATLQARIRALLAEVESLRRGNYSRTAKDDPIWAYLANWPGQYV